MAAVGRAAMTAHFESLGFDVLQIQPDGWCLPACVAMAVRDPGGTVTVLQRALEALHAGHGLAHLDDATRATTMREAGGRLRRFSITQRNISALCNTDLWDPLPQALSLTSGRPLRIDSVDLRSAAGTPQDAMSVTVVDATGQAGREPIVLLRTGQEYGCAHYDLVRDREAGP
jgi:hypothetical protein